jgi:hypothetical protein
MDGENLYMCFVSAENRVGDSFKSSEEKESLDVFKRTVVGRDLVQCYELKKGIPTFYTSIKNKNEILFREEEMTLFGKWWKGWGSVLRNVKAEYSLIEIQGIVARRAT